MEIIFGLLVIVILIVGLLNRRKQNKAWLREERHDESGEWVDKRAGERGTFGSRDAEMEQERRNLIQQGRVSELTRLIRDYAFEHYPGFHSLSDAQIRAYNTFVKTQVASFVALTEQLLAGQTPVPPAQPPSNAPYSLAVKKLMLDFSYRHFPALLDLEIETLKDFDLIAGNVADLLISKVPNGKP